MYIKKTIGSQAGCSVKFSSPLLSELVIQLTQIKLHLAFKKK